MRRYAVTLKNRPAAMLSRPAPPFLLLLLLSGCASYSAKPLPVATSTATLSVDAASLHFTALTEHRFNPTDGLDMTEIAMLAVCHNPDLILARDDAGISRAQAFAAGLLPDPQVALSLDQPVNAPAGTSTAFSLGLSEELSSLIQHDAIVTGATAKRRQVELDLLWQEWQTIAKARLLFLEVQLTEEQEQWLAQNRDLLQAQAKAMQGALKSGSLGLDVAQPVLSAAQDAEQQYQDAATQARQTRFDLNALLGMPADTQLQLVASTPAEPDTASVQEAVAQLPERRPDLIALRAGYAAEEAQLRQAILAQFPSLNIGLTLGRDNTGINSIGPAVGFTLPLFNRNRGGIAIEKATRQRLYDEYQNRLNDAYREISQLQAQQAQDRQRLAGLDTRLTELDTQAAAARKAYTAGALDALSYGNLATARIALHQQAASLRDALAEADVSLEAELGPLPADANPESPAP